jgi:hypothetical protein
MGTDIHAVIQVLIAGSWVTVALNPANGERHYQTFAILAGVRGRGDLPPIALPRGLPADFPVDEEKYHTLPPQPERAPLYWMGSHSYSYLTLAELQKYAKPRLVNTGYVSEEGYWRWNKNSEPTSYYPRVAGSQVVTMTIEEYEKFQTDDTPACEADLYIQIQWQCPLAQTYLPRYIEEMEAVRQAHNCSSTEVRLVFGFDS